MCVTERERKRAACSRCVGSGESGGVLHVTVRVRESVMLYVWIQAHTHRPVTPRRTIWVPPKWRLIST